MEPKTVMNLVYSRLIKKWSGVLVKFNNKDDLAQEAFKNLTQYPFDPAISNAHNPAIYWICLLTDQAVYNDHVYKTNKHIEKHRSLDSKVGNDEEFDVHLYDLTPQDMFVDGEYEMILKEHFAQRSLDKKTVPDYEALKDKKLKFPRGPKQGGNTERLKAITAMKKVKFDSWVAQYGIQPGIKEISLNTLFESFECFAKSENYLDRNTFCKWMKLLFETRTETTYPYGVIGGPYQTIYYKINKYF